MGLSGDENNQALGLWALRLGLEERLWLFVRGRRGIRSAKWVIPRSRWVSTLLGGAWRKMFGKP